MMDQTVQAIHLPDGMTFRDNRARLVFYTCMAALLEAGITLPRAIELTGEYSEDPKLREFCEKAWERMSAGAGLGFILKQFGSCFSSSAYRTIRAAENSGNLPQALKALAAMEERRIRIEGRLRSALVYPGAVLVIALILVVAPALIFGDIQAVFAELGIRMPFYATWLFRISDWASSPWVWLAAIAAGAFFYQELTEERANERFQRWVRMAWSKIPGFSQLIILSSNFHFCHSLGVQLGVGIPLTTALNAAFDVNNDPIMQKAKSDVLEGVKAGATLAEALKSTNLALPLVLVFIESGEEAGQLPESLVCAASYLELLLEAKTQTLLDLIQPVMLMATGVLVGAIAIGTLKPIADLLNI